MCARKMLLSGTLQHSTVLPEKYDLLPRKKKLKQQAASIEGAGTHFTKSYSLVCILLTHEYTQ